MAANPFESNMFGEEEDNVIYVGKREGAEWKDPNKRKRIQNVLDVNGNPRSITSRDKQIGFRNKVKCCKQILDELRKRSNNDTGFYELVDTDEAVRTSLQEQFVGDCWKGGNNKDDGGVDFSYMLNYSIVDSKESYSYSQNPPQNKGKKHFPVFNILGYKRLIVVGVYEQYAKWIVSAYGQRLERPFLYPNLKGQRNNIPCTPFSKFMPDHKRRSGSNMFGSLWYNNLDQTLPVMRATGPPKLEVKTMNYFQLPHSSCNAESVVKLYDTITTELYCDVLEMPYSCKHNLEMAKFNATKNAINAGSTADAAYQQIVAYGYMLGYLLPNSTKETTAICTMLDKITSGGRTSIVGTNSSNITSYKDLSVYHRYVHRANPAKSLPYVCPGKQRLKNLLQRSLQLEKKLMPKFYASPLREEEHKRLFWDVWLEERKMFCWVDIERLFQNARSWDEIINQQMVSINWDAENGSIKERK